MAPRSSISNPGAVAGGDRVDEEIDDPRQELVDKLIEYQKFKKLSELMEENRAGIRVGDRA
jgi:chromatin segregation and condensation protein Rec8/ScpA/Scc1 (kleisin family)